MQSNVSDSHTSTTKLEQMLTFCYIFFRSPLVKKLNVGNRTEVPSLTHLLPPFSEEATDLKWMHFSHEYFHIFTIYKEGSISNLACLQNDVWKCGLWTDAWHRVFLCGSLGPPGWDLEWAGPKPLSVLKQPELSPLIYTMGFCMKYPLINRSLCLEVTSLMETPHLIGWD